MSEKGEYIKAQCNRMKVGDCLRINRFEFSDAFAFGWPTIYETPIQAFLSSMMGSMWGVWRAEQDLETGDIIISRHEESKKRYYVDPDREHLFKRVEDGTLERR
ncbi:hypothetical protein LCGC14_1363780 [marine sediment metagenome]|uniref:Uncharacterized protein n=1 Tax=marine sediment metagenome TaxID=412755 RepID=A0A0F9KTE6_9ZZZZ